MSFFGKRQAVVYLKRDSCLFYPLKGASIRFDFPESAIVDLEVQDAKKLDTELTSFITKNRIKPMQVLLVLSPQVYFQKALQASDEQGAQSEVDRFLDEVPFERGKIAHKVIDVDNTAYIIATNKQLYETIQGVLEGLGFEMIAILPLSSYKEFKEGQDRENFDGTELKRMVNTQDAVREGNLLTTKAALAGSTHEIRASFQLNRVVLLGLLLAILLFVGIALVLFSQFVKQKPASQTSTMESSPSATPITIEEAKTSTESAQIERAKETLTIRVLNGSGIAGIAADVRDRLDTLGFQNIEIGNAKGKSVEETKVRFAKDVSLPIRDLVVADLEKVFLTVVVEEDTSGLTSPIEIITGTELVNP